MTPEQYDKLMYRLLQITMYLASIKKELELFNASQQ